MGHAGLVQPTQGAAWSCWAGEKGPRWFPKRPGLLVVPGGRLCAQRWDRGAEGLGEGFVGSSFAPRPDIWAVFFVLQAGLGNLLLVLGRISAGGELPAAGTHGERRRGDFPSFGKTWSCVLEGNPS